ncbi:snurportin-1-like isoform X2 [Zophobas morio]|uniref:snurportin-1-like isoform X2 n=1 Tax=Zophobas morio TaxID=2755281 RepID=UPI003083906D
MDTNFYEDEAYESLLTPVKRKLEYEKQDNDNILLDGKVRCLSQEDQNSKRKAFFKKQIMRSVIMEVIPENFEKDWIFKLCPRGKRSLVVSSKGETRSYQRNGCCLPSFYSYLPGGNGLDVQHKMLQCWLDCIYEEETEQFYILDVMRWKGQPLNEVPAELRFQWLESKINELLSLAKRTKMNPYPFALLPYGQCCINNIYKALETFTTATRLDGILFFHRRSLYHSRAAAPLCFWVQKMDINRLFFGSS